MADASEVMEEVVTLMHESEAIVTAAAAGVSAGDLQTASVHVPGSTVILPHLPDRCYSISLELSDAYTSVALSTFGMLLKDTSWCPERSLCVAPPLSHVFTGLAQVGHERHAYCLYFVMSFVSRCILFAAH